MREDVPEESWVITVALAPLRATLWLLFWGGMWLLEGDEDEDTDIPEVPKSPAHRVEIPDSCKAHTWTSSHTGL